MPTEACHGLQLFEVRAVSLPAPIAANITVRGVLVRAEKPPFSKSDHEPAHFALNMPEGSRRSVNANTREFPSNCRLVGFDLVKLKFYVHILDCVVYFSCFVEVKGARNRSDHVGVAFVCFHFEKKNQLVMVIFHFVWFQIEKNIIKIHSQYVIGCEVDVVGASCIHGSFAITWTREYQVA